MKIRLGHPDVSAWGKLSVLISLLTLGNSPRLWAASYVWQGGDGAWTDANWTANGTPNQTIGTPPIVYSGHDVVLAADGTVVSAGRVALDGGSWRQSAGRVDLTGTGNLSGMNLGHNGTPSSMILSGTAELILTGSGGAGTAFGGRAGSLIMSNSASVTVNNKNLEIRDGFSITLRETASLTAPYVNFSGSGAANALFTLAGGALTLTSSNPLQTAGLGNSPPGNRVNFTGPAGSARVVNTDNSDPTKNLAAKMAAGLFCIDGTVVYDTDTIVSGRRFSISTAGGTDTLQLVDGAAAGRLGISVVAALPANPIALNPSSADAAGATEVSAGNTKGQTISFASAVTVSNFVFQVDDAGASTDLEGSLRLQVYGTLAGLPFGGLLFSDSGALPAGLAPGDFLQVDLPAPLALARGRYAVALISDDAAVRFKLTTGDLYPTGSLIRFNASSGGEWDFGASSGLDFVFAVQGSVEPEPPLPVGRPNILVILADDLGWTDLSTGNPNLGNASDFYQTPNVERLAREGLAFTSCYMQPNCSPTRAALLSGQYAPRNGNGVYNVDDLNRGDGTPPLVGPSQNEDVPSSTVTVAESLRAAGYVTAHFGKYHVGGHEGGSATLPLNQGFDYNFGGGPAGNPGNYFASGGIFAGNVGPELDFWGPNYTASYISDVLQPLANRAANPNNPATLEGTDKHLSDAMGDALLAYLEDHRTGPLADRPFYIQFHTFAVHTPIQPRLDLEAKYNGLPAGARHDSASYAALVEGLDQQVGRLLDYLDDPNGDGDATDSLTTNTLVIFTSDNGGHMGPTDNQPLRGRKGMFYDGGIRVPLIARQPGTIPTNQVTHTLVHAVDFYPTLIEVAGAQAPDPVQQPLDGVSFAAHLRDPASPRRRSPIYYLTFWR